MKYIPFIFIIFVIACEQVVDIEIPEHESQLVLSSFYEAGDTKVTAYLTKSLPINSNEDVGDIWGAEVSFYENDMLLGQMQEGQDTFYYQFFTGLDSLGNPTFDTQIGDIRRTYRLDLTAPLEVDKTYQIKAEAPDYEAISSTQQIPTLPEVVEVVYKPMSRAGLEGYIMDAFDVKLNDVAGEDNYYELKLYQLRSDNYNPGVWRNAWAESLTPGVEQGNEGALLLKDDLFENSSYNIELLSWPEDTAQVDIKVEIKSISRDKYLFSKSLEAYYNAEGNPFAEPVIIHTNVENGQGIFSMENQTEFLIE